METIENGVVGVIEGATDDSKFLNSFQRPQKYSMNFLDFAYGNPMDIFLIDWVYDIEAETRTITETVCYSWLDVFIPSLAAGHCCTIDFHNQI
jgi:hypothetical protein